MSFSSTMEPTNQVRFIAGRKRPRKQVRFSETEEPIPSSSTVVDQSEELPSSWYNRLELAFFKLDLKHFLQGKNKHDQEARGYERYTPERSQNKKLAIQCTLLAFRHGMKSEEIAVVAKQVSASSRKHSFRLACKDFCEVYRTDLVNLFSDESSNTLPNKNMRQSTLSEKRSLPPLSPEECRRVRPRAA